jgi:general secretion pathway protein D
LARLAASTLLIAASALGDPGAVLAQGTRLNYVNADIRDVIRSLGTVLGVNILLSEEVPAERVTYTTAQPVSPTQVGAVLEAILESEGLVLVQRGPVAEVMSVERAPATGPIHIGKQLPTPPPLGLITQIVPLQFISADEAIAVIGQLASPLARIEVVPRSNSLLITDLSSNVSRYLELLSELDVRSEGEGGLRTYVYRLKHANAAVLATTLGQIFGAAVPAVQAPTPSQSLADRSLSSTLETFQRRELQSLEQRRSMEIPIQLQVTGQPADTAGAGEGIAGLVGATTIVPDLATNSLVIRTSPPNYPVLQETIESLDVRPAQVLLEVLIAEIRLDKSTQYGINWFVFGAGSDTEGTARLGVPAFSDSALAGVDDFLARVVHFGSDIDARAVLTALGAKADVQVLSTPHVLALNNEEARILVGNEVPFSQSALTGIGGDLRDQSVQYRNVGTQLTIIPTINEDGYVSFRILQEVSQLTQQTVEAALGAQIISTREAETSALVADGETVVIGGLIDTGSEVVESGVPLLKDIPLLGYLFKSQTTRKFRTELAIFVTPYVVFSDEDAADLLERERGRLQNREEVDEALPPPDEGGY